MSWDFFCFYFKAKKKSLIDSSVNDEVANRTSDEKNSCTDISKNDMEEKNTTDDQKQQRGTEIKIIRYIQFCEHFFSQ